MKLKYKQLGPQDQYFKDWKEYRRRHHMALVPVVALILSLLAWATLNGNKWAIVALAASFGAMLIFGNYAYYWRCPRCQKSFNMDYLWMRYPLSKCCHCGLPRWAANEKVNNTNED